MHSHGEQLWVKWSGGEGGGGGGGTGDITTDSHRDGHPLERKRRSLRRRALPAPTQCWFPRASKYTLQRRKARKNPVFIFKKCIDIWLAFLLNKTKNMAWKSPCEGPSAKTHSNMSDVRPSVLWHMGFGMSCIWPNNAGTVDARH